MSYKATITYPVKRTGRLAIVIVETDAAAGDEAGPIVLPDEGRIVLFSQKLVSGAGTTTDPRIGRVAGWADQGPDEVARGLDTAPGAFHRDASKVPYRSAKGELFMRSTVDAGADNKIVTEIEIVPEIG